MEKLLSIEQAAEALNLSVKTLYNWVHLKKIHYEKVGKAVKFRPCRIQKYIEDHEVAPHPVWDRPRRRRNAQPQPA